MPKRNRFRDWLYSADLAVFAYRLCVTKTTIREWRTGRSYPHPLRHRYLIQKAAEDGWGVRLEHMTRSAK